MTKEQFYKYVKSLEMEDFEELSEAVYSAIDKLENRFAAGFITGFLDRSRDTIELKHRLKSTEEWDTWNKS